MERILNLQKLSESAYGSPGEAGSDVSNGCSAETNGCSTITNGCDTVATVTTYW